MRAKIENWIQINLSKTSVLLASIGLITCLISLYSSETSTMNNFLRIFKLVDLEFLELPIFHLEGGSFNGEWNKGGNILNLSFYFIFLGTSIVFFKNKKKESNFIKFIYAVIHFYMWISISLLLLAPSKESSLFELSTLLHIAFNLIILVYSYLILKTYDRKLQDEVKDKNFKKEYFKKYPESSKGQRFNNHLIDTLLILFLTLTAFIRIAPKNLISSSSELLGEGLTFAFIMGITSIIYYVYFEFIFKRTPAKFLNNTFVIRTNHRNSRFEAILHRNMIRRIPFNALSFFSKNGWHDTMSNTTVITTKKRDNESGYYKVILLLFVCLFLNYQFNNFRKKYVTYNKENGIIKNEANTLLNQLKNIKVNDYVSLIKLNASHTNRCKYHFKVLEIEKDTLTIAKIENKYYANLNFLSSYYENFPNTFEKLKVHKNFIKKGICTNYEFFNGIENSGFKYFKNTDKLIVYSINNPNEPLIKFESMHWNEKRLSIKLQSFGVDCELFEIKTLHKDITSDNYLPKQITDNHQYVNFSIDTKEKFCKVKVLLRFRNQKNYSIHEYIFETNEVFEVYFNKTGEGIGQ